MAWERKADDVVVLDVAKLSQFTNYFILVSGQVDQHLKAITDYVVDTLRREGVKPHHIEGLDHLQWILIDYVDVLVNVFLPDVRQFYDLEALWGEAESIPLPFVEEE